MILFRWVGRLMGRLILTVGRLALVVAAETRICRKRRRGMLREPAQHTATVAGFVAGGLGLASLVPRGAVSVALMVAAFIAVAVAFLAVIGEWRANRPGEYITDGDDQTISPIADVADVAAGHTPSHRARSRQPAGVR